MSNKSGIAEQIISLPKGGGGINGLGEKFEPDLHTGTGNFSIPIAVPSGRNGFQPLLSLSYSTGAPNSPFGLGWSISHSNISRKISKGIPKYRDTFVGGRPVWNPDEDIFILSGSGDLVHVGDGLYRPRTEGLFARIQKVKSADGKPCWVVTSKSGIKSTYGTAADSRIYVDDNGINISQWLLAETEDTFGNKVVYTYKRDNGADLQSDPQYYPEERNHTYNQLYLHEIKYVEYKEHDAREQKFLWLINFDYGEYDNEGNEMEPSDWKIRPDRFSQYRTGFELRTARRCNRILIKRRLEGNADRYELIKAIELNYEQDKLTNISLLKEVRLKGYRGSVTESFPPVTFGYTKFDIQNRRYENFSAMGGYMPERSLGDSNYEILDLFGNGLPCIVHSNPNGWRYWRNLGNMQFAFPRPMKYSPAGILLADDGVQFADMNGDGSADLLVTTDFARGYYEKSSINGEWSAFHHYHQAPSFDLKDPNSKLVDMNGDGVIDILATFDHHFLVIQNKNHDTDLEFDQPVAIGRVHDLDSWPDVFFASSDQRTHLSDMSGDGMQDMVLIHSGRIDYWPNMGYGKFGKRITMSNSPRFPSGFDAKRIFLTDINGDGLADIIYVEYGVLHLWINQSGNSWSDEHTIHGTPTVTDADSVRIADMNGTGTAGVLWSYDYSSENKRNYKFLDFTGERKPFLLNSIVNNIGSETKIEYLPSTFFYLEDMKNGLIWKTTLPFPVQVVASVDSYDRCSKGRLTRRYFYHHGYWDGLEREFCGFGRVDQRDTESFEDFNSNQLHSNEEFNNILAKFFSPPIETRTWFHQGTIRDEETGASKEIEFADEFWPSDSQTLNRPATMTDFIDSLPTSLKKNALQTLRGHILRTEVYALDNTQDQDRPYTVSEHLNGILSLPIGEPWSSNTINKWRKQVFYPNALAERITQWERGSEPMTNFRFMEDYDRYGQSHTLINIAIPRGRDFRIDAVALEGYLATKHETVYAIRDDEEQYIVDRVASTKISEIPNDGSLSLYRLRDNIIQNRFLPVPHVISHTINYYDGPPFEGLQFKQIGDNAALMRTEILVLTKEILHEAYRNGNFHSAGEPPYLVTDDNNPVWNEEYAEIFQNQLHNLAGYVYHTHEESSEFETGFYSQTERVQYDFHGNSREYSRGLVTARLDALGNDTTISYDSLELVPNQIIDSKGLSTIITYDPRVLRPNAIIDPNGNQSNYTFTPLGHLESISIKGKRNENVGDISIPGTQLTYELDSLMENGQPIHITTLRRVDHLSEETIKEVKYYDSFGRVIQTRTQAESAIFGDPLFGDSGLPAEQSDPANRRIIAQHNESRVSPNVIVSGWQVYDNKGRIIEKYEPFFSKGWTFGPPQEGRRGEKLTFYYDPVGRIIRTVNPDGSEQRIVYGVLNNLSNLESYDASPWEVNTYDENDNAGRTHIEDSREYSNHYNTPVTTVLDALGHRTKFIERKGTSERDWYTTTYLIDIRGNILSIIDRLKRVESTFIYDLSSNSRVLRTEHIDAGIQCSIFDAAGNLIEQRDNKGALILRSFDRLNRVTRVWARDKEDRVVSLREVLIYGDDEGNSGLTRRRAAGLNLLGKLYKHYDEAGLLIFVPDSSVRDSKPYDFKGNILEKVRYVINDSYILNTINNLDNRIEHLQNFSVDWQPPNGVRFVDHASKLLDPVDYRTSFQYDALNRIKSLYFPADVTRHRKKLSPRYNHAGALESIKLNQTTYVKHIAYNAKGQRILIAYGNGIMTRYRYDIQNFRMVRLRSEHYESPSELIYDTSGSPLQDFMYAHDLVGNILTLLDTTKKSGIPNTALGRNKLNRVFTYDPLYRLTSATGREHRHDFSQISSPWDDNVNAIDITLSRGYTEEYHYDIIGNMDGMKHESRDGNGYRHVFDFHPTKNRIARLARNRISYDYEYDACGNMIKEGGVRNFDWDHSNRMQHYFVRARNAQPSLCVFYLYDPTGNRIKKIVYKQNRHHEVTVYLDNIFEHKQIIKGNNIDENNTLHIMDVNKRVAHVRIGNALGRDRSSSIKYELADHIGNSSIVVGNNGAIINREEYSPYGITTFGSYAKKSFRFSGKLRDEENRFYYFGARYYPAWLGRWISTEIPSTTDRADAEEAEIQSPYSLHQYIFNNNNPMRYFDINGYKGKDIWNWIKRQITKVIAAAMIARESEKQRRRKFLPKPAPPSPHGEAPEGYEMPPRKLVPPGKQGYKVDLMDEKDKRLPVKNRDPKKTPKLETNIPEKRPDIRIPPSVKVDPEINVPPSVKVDPEINVPPFVKVDPEFEIPPSLESPPLPDIPPRGDTVHNTESLPKSEQSPSWEFKFNYDMPTLQTQNQQAQARTGVLMMILGGMALILMLCGG